MSFEQPTKIRFCYNGEQDEYTIQKIELNGWVVCCSHEIFTKRFSGGCFNNPLGEILNFVNFGDSDYDFFREMGKSFMDYPFED